MQRATEAAKAALAKDQRRRVKYYDRRVRQHAEFDVGDRVWVLRPPRGKGLTKLTHQWLGPVHIVVGAGFDNWKVEREDTGEHLIVHCSFLVSCHCPSDSLSSVAERILREMAEEDNDVGSDAEEPDQNEEAVVRGGEEATVATADQMPTADGMAAVMDERTSGSVAVERSRNASTEDVAVAEMPAQTPGIAATDARASRSGAARGRATPSLRN
ncbi:hypothetical protein PHYSODRAFT_471543 [Phytophthora sojae]|uniref:Uncharacterized protein n=1 Tax=Phytophthora sojae (strain P6497) TaxID=1094619 RepID=G4YPA3_PHYSP|nr:hypothetical protein PHYSODRAFT_471543 [Phytophthora sojae]EGZ27237.1 hypothetical protein PHYSODRAFT_471543 [Phytophthora sojae]|eukprot:XP_009514512.1 hypothetical protein PHYSODRAFT_471543 [Phytophthora sojae]